MVVVRRGLWLCCGSCKKGVAAVVVPAGANNVPVTVVISCLFNRAVFLGYVDTKTVCKAMVKLHSWKLP